MVLACCLTRCRTVSRARKECKFKVFENKIRSTISRPMRLKETEWWRLLHFEEFHNVHCVLNRLKEGKKRGTCSTHAEWEKHKTLIRNLGATSKLWDLDLDSVIILKVIFRKSNMRLWAGFIRIWVRLVMVSCEHGYELPIKYERGTFLSGFWKWVLLRGVR